MLQRQEYQNEGVRLSLEYIRPEGQTKHSLIFYYGGGWIHNNRSLFHRFAQDLAREGIAVYLPQYRVYATHGTSPRTAVRDVTAGIDFVMEQMIPGQDRKAGVSWGGASAGGQLVLCAAGRARQPEGPNFLPNKLVLFNPVCCTCSIQPAINTQAGTLLDLSGLCPLHDLPVLPVPTHIFHGTSDTVALFSDAERFVQRCADNGCPVTLQAYRGRGHAFHHYTADPADYQDTLRATVKFLLNAETE